MGVKSLFISFALIGLFVIALMNFGILLQNENNSSIQIIDDPRINKTFGDLNQNLSQENLKDDVSEKKKTFETEEPQISQGNLLLNSIKFIWTGISDTITGVYNIINGLIFQTLFGSTFSVLLSVLGAILSALVILFGWQLFRTGRAD